VFKIFLLTLWVLHHDAWISTGIPINTDVPNITWYKIQELALILLSPLGKNFWEQILKKIKARSGLCKKLSAFLFWYLTNGCDTWQYCLTITFYNFRNLQGKRNESLGKNCCESKCWKVARNFVTVSNLKDFYKKMNKLY